MGAIQSISAAAARILTRKGGRGVGNSVGNSVGNASLAWDMYEQVPEVGAYADYVSNAMQGAALFAGRRTEDGDVERAPEGSRAAELVAAMAGGLDGQTTLLGEFGTQLAVAGEAWLVIVPNLEADTYAGDRWVVVSTEEVKVQRGKVTATVDGEVVEIPEYDPDVPQDDNQPVAIRVWKPSPRRHQDATSPVIRSLTILEELRLLNAAVAAIARSRITGRGVLLVPAGTRFPATPGQEQAEDNLLDTFVEVASTAIREPESAAATVPIVLEVPGDMINGVKWLQFTSEFDTMAQQLRDEAVRRFATGADVPAEVLLGLGDASHWGAWALTAEALRMGAEPRLALVCHALTSAWLRPLLEAENAPDAEEWMVWYDTSGLRSSSNKGASALEAFREGLVSGEAARRELGFTEADAPDSTEIRRAMDMRRRRTGTRRGELPVSETEAPPAEPGSESQPDPSRLMSAAVLDSFTSGTTAALAEAVDGLVWTALDVAGRKLLLTPVVPRADRPKGRELAASGVLHTAYALPDEGAVDGYRLLDDAWVRVPVVANRYGLDAVALASALDTYTRALLLSGQAHDFDNVPRLLAQMNQADAA